MRDLTIVVGEAIAESIEIQNKTQQHEAEMLLYGTKHMYKYLDENENVSDGLSGAGKVVKGAIGIASGTGLILAPVPTPADDLVGVRKITFGIYSVCYGIAEIVGAIVG